MRKPGKSENIRKSGREGMRADAYLTVYLTLTMTVILSLCLALIEGTRQNAFFLEAECVTDIGLNSILAEYHRELLAQYNLFAIDSSYGGPVPRVNAAEEHFKQYVEKNLSTEDLLLDWLLYRNFLGIQLEDAQLSKASLLTDDEGAVFRRRAAEAVWDDMNLNLFRELQGWMQVVDSEELTERDIAAEKRKLDQKLNSYDGEEVQISETEWITVEVKNPTSFLEKKRKEGILKWVVEDSEELSNKTLPMGELIMARMEAGNVNGGNGELSELSETEQLLERFFFQEYLMRYLGHYGAESEDDVLTYQVEYLVVGKENDLDNLRSVVNAIFAVREVANTSYIMTDTAKKSIAELLASTLACAMEIPEAADLIKLILLYGWAFAESIHDMKCLMAGGRIPLMKSEETWYYSLERALKLEDADMEADSEGLSYEDYLRIFMMLQKKDVLTARAMNMVEADIRQTPGNESFRLDGCLDCVEACVKYKSAYGYTCEIRRQKGYSMQ